MELKANELRIGNLVSDIHASESFYAEIKKITQDRIYYGSFNSHPKDLKPIPLTEECLLKFGFIQDTGEPERFFNDIISLTKYKNAWTIEYNNNDFVFEYVHELQNLHFILKKEELKI